MPFTNNELAEADDERRTRLEKLERMALRGTSKQAEMLQYVNIFLGVFTHKIAKKR
jgi:hypothetical protein